MEKARWREVEDWERLQLQGRDDEEFIGVLSSPTAVSSGYWFAFLMEIKGEEVVWSVVLCWVVDDS